MDSIRASVNASKHALSRLETLPAELLYIVFDIATVGIVFKVLHPLSKALQPFVQRIQYRNISIDYSHFLLLCPTIYDSPRLAKFIITLELVDGDFISATDYEVEQEDLVFNFFNAAAALEQLDGLEDHPLLQLRITSAKYALRCFKSLKALRLYFSGEGSDPSSLLQQSRCLSRFQSLESVDVTFERKRSSNFEEEQEDAFEEEDRLEIVRSGLGFSVGNAIVELHIEGYLQSPLELHDFIARFWRLENLSLVEVAGRRPGSILARLDPVHLTRLFVQGDEERGVVILEAEISHLVNLRELSLPGTAYTTELATTLSKFAKLVEIFVLPPGDPTPSAVRIILHPLTRPPALKLYNFQPSSWIECDDGHMDVCDYDPVEQGIALPTWGDDWTVRLVREMLVLGEREGIELVGREICEKAIEMTEEYEAAEGATATSDSESRDAE